MLIGQTRYKHKAQLNSLSIITEDNGNTSTNTWGARNEDFNILVLVPMVVLSPSSLVHRSLVLPIVLVLLMEKGL